MLSIRIYASINDRSYSLNTPLAWSASRLPNNLLGIDELSAVYRRSKQRAVIDATTTITPTTTTPTTDATTPSTDRSKSTRPLSSSSRIIRYYSNDRSAESNETSDDDSRSSNNNSNRRRTSDKKTQQSDRLDGMTVCLIALDEGFRELQAL